MAKTEVLSMRIDAKTKFLIEYLCRVNGHSISTTVEQAIERSARKLEEAQAPICEWCDAPMHAVSAGDTKMWVCDDVSRHPESASMLWS